MFLKQSGNYEKKFLDKFWISLVSLISCSLMILGKPTPHYVVVGGGVCGVTCCQSLSELHSCQVTLIAGQGLLKGVANVVRVSRFLDSFEIVDQSIDAIDDSNSRVYVGTVENLDPVAHRLTLRDGNIIKYDKICICTGARPRSIAEHPRVLCLRDSDSVRKLLERLSSARRVMVVGNGGVALELVHEIHDCEIVWSLRHGHIGNAFFDPEAAAFLFPSLASRVVDVSAEENVSFVGGGGGLAAAALDSVHGVREEGLERVLPPTPAPPDPPTSQPLEPPPPPQDPLQQPRKVQGAGGGDEQVEGGEESSRYSFGMGEDEPAPSAAAAPATGPAAAATPVQEPAAAASVAAAAAADTKGIVGVQVCGEAEEKRARVARRRYEADDDDESDVFRHLESSGEWVPDEKQPSWTDTDLPPADKGGAATGGAAAAAGGPRHGSAMGGQWLTGSLGLHWRATQSGKGGHIHGGVAGCKRVLLEKFTTVTSVAEAEQGAVWPLLVTLSNGHVYGCDYVVCGTGAVPNTDFLRGCPGLELDADGGILVNSHMESSVPDLYAAGDACTVRRAAGWANGAGAGATAAAEEEEATDPGPLWFQMRLWTQARQQGQWAAACMLGKESVSPCPLELFAHVTRFLGHKVILLGLYNGQGLPQGDGRSKVMVRSTPGKEYVRVTLRDGRMVGALLLGETDLEETFENLMLNRLDLSPFGQRLLDPNLDLEDYFD